jgi:hypothetical protein
MKEDLKSFLPLEFLDEKYLSSFQTLSLEIG